MLFVELAGHLSVNVWRGSYQITSSKGYWSGFTKCERNLTLDCQIGEGFLKLAWVKLPDLLEFQLNESWNLKECERECFNNCSCRAYANLNMSGRGNGCLMWFGDLIDIREQSNQFCGQDIYIRVPASELGWIFSESGYGSFSFYFKAMLKGATRKQMQSTCYLHEFTFCLHPQV